MERERELVRGAWLLRWVAERILLKCGLLIFSGYVWALMAGRWSCGRDVWAVEVRDWTAQAGAVATPAAASTRDLLMIASTKHQVTLP